MVKQKSNIKIELKDIKKLQHLYIDIFSEEDEDYDEIEIYCGSLIGNKPSLLQIENLGLDDYQFCLQIYGGDYPVEFKNIFNLHEK